MPSFNTPPDLARSTEGLRVTHALPGLAWAAAPLDGPLLAGASGVRRLGQREPLTLHDRLHLGSCTKPITATTLATLVPCAMTWDMKVTDVFGAAQVHRAYHDVTLAHLLSHTAGLPPFDEDEHFLEAPPFSGDLGATREDVARFALSQAPVAEVGEYRYSNAAFGIAAVMAERCTGRPWEALMQKEVFEPLGLTSAGFGWPARDHPGEPWGHEPGAAESTWSPHDPNGAYQLHPGIGPAGDVHMSILDFGVFTRDHLRGLHGRGQVLQEETYVHLHTPVVESGRTGLGWGVSGYRGRRASSHSGSADTFTALMLVLPDEGWAFVVVTNSAGEAADAGTRATLGHLVGRFTQARVTG